jgi:Xaa-Pro aminopeptidase
MQNHSENIPQLSRQAKLYHILKSGQLDSLILNPGPSLVYLTGLHFHLSERPVLVIFMPDAAPIIVLPELEQEKLKHLPYQIQAFPYGEDPSGWGHVFKHAAQAAKLDNKRTGVEPRQLRYLEYRLLSEASPDVAISSAEDIISKMRMYKDEHELSAMRKAADIAEKALHATLPQVKIGLTERELAAELTLQLLRAGCDPEIPFSPIVSSGPNAANPHATPSERKLSVGDLLVIDWGASYEGYCSDITRTFAIGDLQPELKKICKVVLNANKAGRKTARPGITAETIDQAAREVITSAGFGKYFTHRTGHGLGMEGHEDPYIRAGNLMLLEPGMTFTIEPGIYLPGKNGVRIEDNVAITPTGAECLTSFPRDVRQLV